jgi:hypothetical protein
VVFHEGPVGTVRASCPPSIESGVGSISFVQKPRDEL